MYSGLISLARRLEHRKQLTMERTKHGTRRDVLSIAEPHHHGAS
jgi:hypothetical protein